MKYHGWSATILRMVTHHSKDGHPPSKIYKKEEYYTLEIWQLDLTHKIKTRWSTMDGQPQSSGWSGHPPSQGWSPTVLRMVTQLPKSTRRNWIVFQTRNMAFRLNSQNKDLVMDGHPPSQGWSSTLPRIVIHHTQDSQIVVPGHSSNIDQCYTDTQSGT